MSFLQIPIPLFDLDCFIYVALCIISPLRHSSTENWETASVSRERLKSHYCVLFGPSKRWLKRDAIWHCGEFRLCRPLKVTVIMLLLWAPGNRRALLFLELSQGANTVLESCVSEVLQETRVACFRRFIAALRYSIIFHCIIILWRVFEITLTFRLFSALR